MATQVPSGEFEPVATIDELEEAGSLVVRPGDRSIAIFEDEDEIFAVDNRCPHMGFPLTEGTVDDGILTCHWHHARFELSCGDTFDPFADDVQTYPVEVHDDTIYVHPDPERKADPVTHWTERLEHGLRENIGLVIAKSVIGLEDEGEPPERALATASTFGTQYNADGWGSGMTTLGVMANLYDAVSPDDRRRALNAGISEVASECAGQPPFFAQEPLSATDVSPEQLTDWFRHNVEVRDTDGAERVLRAAVRADVSQPHIANMLVGAATDHLYLDNGHRLDFINKAFELLDKIGWEHADEVLPSLVPGLADARRAEERSSWRQPIDLAGLLFDTYEELPAAATTPRDDEWIPPTGLIDTLLGDDPSAIVEALLEEVEAGAPANLLAETVTHAAATRVAQFGTSNEFNDWNTVHHTYSYVNAVHALTARADNWERYRGILDGAMSVYLDRFLNMPPAPIPSPSNIDRDPEAVLEELMECFEVERDEEVNRAGQLTAQYLAADGDVDVLKRKLGKALLREDVGFHTRQNVEAAFAQYDRTTNAEFADVHLVASARYLAAHTPTRRAGEQTYRIAERLNRGERIHEAAGND